MCHGDSCVPFKRLNHRKEELSELSVSLGGRQTAVKSEHLFTLRLWREQADETQVWRASLKDLRTKEVHYFHTLESLMKFLSRQSIKGSIQE